MTRPGGKEGDESIPAKPTWHYGGTFDAAWAGTLKMAQLTAEANPELSKDYRLTLSAMAGAHVVTLDREQYLALPQDYDALTDFIPDPHLPFEIIYVSVGDPMLAGMLLTHHGDTVGIIPFWGYKISGRDRPGAPYQVNWNRPAWWDDFDNPTARMDEPMERVLPTGILNATTHHWSDWIADLIQGKRSIDDKLSPQEGLEAITPTLERALAVVRFLESANVDIEDTPVSRQVRRQAGRKGQPIAQRVYVRSPRHRHRSDGSTEHLEFTHRFEVRGHYKHYGEDTRLFRATERDRPHKIIQHPKLGRVVRIWCPDFVKGPEDRPLVVKTRVYKRNQDAT